MIIIIFTEFFFSLLITRLSWQIQTKSHQSDKHIGNEIQKRVSTGIFLPQPKDINWSAVDT